MSETLDVKAMVRRKDASLPRYIKAPASFVAAWGRSATTPVEVTLDGIDVGRRNLKPWGHGRDCWFLELPDRLCHRARVDTGVEVAVTLRLASTTLRIELVSLIHDSSEAKRQWEALTSSQQRMLADHVRDAKRPATRKRRAEKVLYRRS